MKLLAIFILHNEDDTKVKILQNEFNLSHVSYFQRPYIRSFLIFSARTIIERTKLNIRQSIEIEQNVNATMHAYVRSDGLASVVISNNDYPKRVAHALLSRVMEDFVQIYPPASWERMAEGSGKMTSLNGTLEKYQNPADADAMTGLQKNIDETREILVNTLEKLIERGENIDDLVARSIDLDFQAKAFYKTARKTNRCCNLF